MTFIVVKDWKAVAHRFASDALLELSAAGIATPEKGFIEEPAEFRACIADLRRERDRMRQQLTQQDRILEEINAAMAEIKPALADARVSIHNLEVEVKNRERDLAGAAMAESYRLQLEECDRKLEEETSSSRASLYKAVEKYERVAHEFYVFRSIARQTLKAARVHEKGCSYLKDEELNCSCGLATLCEELRRYDPPPPPFHDFEGDIT